MLTNPSTLQPVTSVENGCPVSTFYALHLMKVYSSVTFATLVLFQRLKARFHTAQASLGHRPLVGEARTLLHKPLKL
jgi:hypothetical protein